MSNPLYDQIESIIHEARLEPNEVGCGKYVEQIVALVDIAEAKGLDKGLSLAAGIVSAPPDELRDILANAATALASLTDQEKPRDQ